MFSRSFFVLVVAAAFVAISIASPVDFFTSEEAPVGAPIKDTARCLRSVRFQIWAVCHDMSCPAEAAEAMCQRLHSAAEVKHLCCPTV